MKVFSFIPSWIKAIYIEKDFAKYKNSSGCFLYFLVAFAKFSSFCHWWLLRLYWLGSIIKTGVMECWKSNLNCIGAGKPTGSDNHSDACECQSRTILGFGCNPSWQILIFFQICMDIENNKHQGSRQMSLGSDLLPLSWEQL